MVSVPFFLFQKKLNNRSKCYGTGSQLDFVRRCCHSNSQIRFPSLVSSKKNEFTLFAGVNNRLQSQFYFGFVISLCCLGILMILIAFILVKKTIVRGGFFVYTPPAASFFKSLHSIQTFFPMPKCQREIQIWLTTKLPTIFGGGLHNHSWARKHRPCVQTRTAQ